MFSGRGRRVAACTALALSAGMLLATPASADDADPAARAFAEQKQAQKATPKTLSLPQAGTARAGAQAAADSSPLLSDLDGDGQEDLIYRDTYGYLNSVTASGVTLFGDVEAPFVKDVVPIGDQGEGSLPEVLTVSPTGTLTLYKDASELGSVDAEFNDRPGVFVGNGWQAYNKVFSPGDVNGDGRADVIGRTPSGQLYLYLGTGDLSKPLGGRTLVGTGWGKFDQLVGLGDGNGDGFGDVYARDTAGQLYFYAGTGDTTKLFAPAKAIGGGWNTFTQLVAGGHGSLLARDLGGTLYYYAPKGDGTLVARIPASEAGAWADAAQIGNSGTNPYAGREGVHAFTPGGSWYWYRNTTTGRLESRELIGSTNEWAGFNLFGLSSLDNSGFSDLGEVWDGAFYVNDLKIGNGWGVYSAIVAPGDLTGDGKGDLVARDKNGTLWLYKGNGAGTGFATRVSLGGGWNAFNKILGAGDYTGDGLTDLLARTTAGELYVYPGTGNASAPFRPRALIGTGWNTYKQLASPGDLNADGKADIIGVNSAGELYRYFNTSPARFAPKYKIGTGYQAYNKIN
ncbi:FG-GAP-like repeat-containing protein [Streptomyces sp. G2]|uniref:FG-GAP-like repeat-containing protein n=1 Tax=Streptomyces TaxID=1883 RepID=UPI00202E3643|nr:FG-GAP-like repeat-containing protein [Streptomyces sp. G2]MCM1945329.1 FG-GAP-like repeat-containing protein [Streptomyces sp. G2]